jgi:hypothetical protein
MELPADNRQPLHVPEEFEYGFQTLGQALRSSSKCSVYPPYIRVTLAKTTRLPVSPGRSRSVSIPSESGAFQAFPCEERLNGVEITQ